uniref:Putative capsid n=1 Tax=Aedes iflavi-like virus 1 TaxID=2798295 RepID=A0A7T4V797_9VIRU|nr:putative capsid [Aedes iflavi-like virus 1]
MYIFNQIHLIVSVSFLFCFLNLLYSIFKRSYSITTVEETIQEFQREQQERDANDQMYLINNIQLINWTRVWRYLRRRLSRSRLHTLYTSGVRNYLASNRFYAYRQTESNYGGTYCITITLRTRDGSRQLLFVRREGNSKRNIFEDGYKEVFQYLMSWKPQGLDSNQQTPLAISTDENVEVSDKKENVIIEGAETRETKEAKVNLDHNLINWSTTEGTYDFTEGEGSIMARWMPLSSVEVNQTIATRAPIWQAKIIEDIAALKNINVLPMRGFMLGKFDVEFKLVLQATPFQACSLLLSWCPHPYGLMQYNAMVGTEALEATKLNQRLPKYVPFRDYLDVTTAVQRPNVILDVASGGEAVLRVGQKFHRTFIRNFDFDRVTGVNMGIRGGYQGLLLLHQLTPVMVGNGTQSSFTARIFYRFVEAKLTAMTQPVEARTKVELPYMYVIPKNEDAKFTEMSSVAAEEQKRTILRTKYRTQGPAMGALSLIRGVGMTATGLIASVEAVSMIRGTRPRNRDKPNDIVGQVVVSPRPRPNFTNGEGIDGAAVIGLSFSELTNVLESFSDEPTSYKDFVNINGLLTTFEWNTGDAVGSNLWVWNGHPTDSGKALTEDQIATGGFSVNQLFTPLSIASSGFTNYAGTIKLYFQFVKTIFHKGAVEVSIQYGRELVDNALENSYVKVINLQDCAGFEMVFPYIYDTPMRSITGTSTPSFLPSVATSDISAMVHSARITVRVLNRLVAPDTVANYVQMLVWMKGGEDFVLSFPRPYNTTLAYPTGNGFYPPQIIPYSVGATVPE